MHETAAVAKKLEKLIPNDYVNPYRLFMFKCSVLNWLEGKQVNAILSIISVLVGVVFLYLQLVSYTSACSQI